MTRAEKHQRWEDMRAYKAQGHTMQEVADKFGVVKGTAQLICKGIAPQPAISHYSPKNKGVLKADGEVARFIEERMPEAEYAGNYTGADGRVDLRCKQCGTIFNRSMISVRKGHCACPDCTKRKADEASAAREEVERIKAEEKERKRKEREAKAQERKAEEERKRTEREHPCPVCGTITHRPKFCSNECYRKTVNQRGELRRRNLIKSALIDKDISVDGLYRRDKGICALCGKPCNLEDYTMLDGIKICGDWYPSVDHIIPLAKGGLHSWDNVQLAHRRCNWEKSDNV